MNTNKTPMNLSEIARLTCAVIGGVALVAEGAIEIGVHHFGAAADYWLIESLLAAGLLLTLGGLFELHTRISNPRRALNAGFVILAGGQMAIASVAFASAIAGRDVLGPIFALGALSWMVGSLTIGVTALLGRNERRALYGTLALAMISAFLVGHGGLAIVGVYWWVAAALLARPLSIAPRRSTASVLAKSSYLPR